MPKTQLDRTYVLGNPTFMVVIEKKKKYLLKIKDTQITKLSLLNLDSDHYEITFDILDGIERVNPEKLAYQLRKPVKTLWNMIKKMLENNFELLNREDYDFLVSWIIGTYLHHELKIFPYIHFHAPKGSGKSTALDTLTELCFNGAFYLTVTPAVVREIEATSPTLLIDECEQLYEQKNASETMNQVQAILKSGYKKGAYVPRFARRKIGKKDVFEKERFSTYCPKAFASIKDIDSTLKDRCKTIHMIKSKKNFDRDQEQLNILMHRTLAHVILNHKSLLSYQDKAIKQLLKWGLSGRQLELMKPIVTIALAFEKNVKESVQAFVKEQESYEMIIGIEEKQLIEVLHFLVNEGREWYYIHDIRERFKELVPGDSEWVSHRYISKLLKRLGFTDTRRGTGNRTQISILKSKVDWLVTAYNLDFSEKSDEETKIPEHWVK
jgi:hypothetical protein